MSWQKKDFEYTEISDSRWFK